MSDAVPETSKLKLRLYEPGIGWKLYSDSMGADGKISEKGSQGKFDSILLNALNATNLLFLAGSGASLGVKNSAGKAAPSMSDLWNAVTQKIPENKFKEISQIVPIPKEIAEKKDIEKLLSQCKMYLELNEAQVSESTNKIADFVQTAQTTILATADFIDHHTDLSAHIGLLRKIGRRPTRKPRARVYTTNYDLCFEESSQRLGLVQIDGFSHSLPQKYDRTHFLFDLVRRELGKEVPEYVDGVFHLYKLHGSIDWRRVSDGVVRTRGTEGEPVLIYPRNSKYQEAFEVPYLDMMSSFQSALLEPDTTLIVCGFGFNDNHISQPIISALETNMSLRLVLCAPSLSDLDSDEHVVNGKASQKAANDFVKRICIAAEQDFGRITLVAGKFGEFSKAIPDIVAETERERFAERSRLLRTSNDIKKDGDANA